MDRRREQQSSENQVAMAAPTFSFIVVALALLHVTALGVIPERGAEFGYLGQVGPRHWAQLNPQFQECKAGKSQSPININTDLVVLNSTLKPLTRNYRPGKATLVNNGFNLAVRFEEEVGSVSVDGKKYGLKQMHWHTPAEHSIDGNKYAAEMHLVHRTDEGNATVVVVSILYHFGRPDPFLHKIKRAVEELAGDGDGDGVAQVDLGTIPTKFIKRTTRKYYRYLGSLTTPPCTEPVIWNILGKVRSISRDQVAALRAPLYSVDKLNARPQQHLNGRLVQLYDHVPSGDT